MSVTNCILLNFCQDTEPVCGSNYNRLVGDETGSLLTAKCHMPDKISTYVHLSCQLFPVSQWEGVRG